MSRQEIRKIYRTAVGEEFPDTLKLTLGDRTVEYSKAQWSVEDKRRGLRYGTNPHQKAALYRPKGSTGGIGNVEWLKWGKGGPSATNIEDGSHGNRIVSYFDKPSASVMKHLNPSGVAVQRDEKQTLDRVYAQARDADTRAAFGSVVVFNTAVDRPTAEEIMKTYVEVVYAPDYRQDALRVFETKKDIRIGRIQPRQPREIVTPDIVVLDDGSVILEDSYRTNIKSLDHVRSLPVATKRKPSDDEYVDLLQSWVVACEVRSNAIVLWKDGVSIAIGTGQQDRVGALENCVEKARRAGRSLKGSSLASDGFFPKTDNIELAAAEGVTGIIQPGGSVEDREVIEACDKHGIAMVLTGERSFRHF